MMHVNDKWSQNPGFTLEDWRRQQLDEAWKSDQTSEMPVYEKRRSAGLWTAVAVLTVALAVVAGYGYWILREDNIQLSELPGLTRSLEAVGLRLIGMESRLSSLSSNQAALAAQTKQLDSAYSSGLDGVRRYTQDLVAQMNYRLQKELSARTEILEARLASQDSGRQQEQEQLAKLEKELASAHQELAVIREKYTRQLAALHRQETENQGRIASISSQLATDRVTFEIQRDQEEEIIPGVSLHVTNVDVRHQLFDGWIWFTPDRQTIRIHSQGIQQPVVFYPKHSDEAYELVVTQVNQKGAAGYLFVPAQAQAQQAVLASGDKSAANTMEASF